MVVANGRLVGWCGLVWFGWLVGCGWYGVLEPLSARKVVGKGLPLRYRGRGYFP